MRYNEHTSHFHVILVLIYVYDIGCPANLQPKTHQKFYRTPIIPKETIAAALGHGGNTVTDIYIEFDYRKVDEANRRVLNWVLYGYEGGYAPQEVDKPVTIMPSLREAKSSRNVVGFEFGKVV